MNNIRILYCAYGRAGYFVLNLLMEKLGISAKNLICFTYIDKENKPLLKALEKYEIKYMTFSLKKEKSRRYVENFSPDVIVSMHYRDIIPKSILQLAKLGGFNLHPSLLPKYRGCFSAPWVIINGESKTGITYHYMDEIFDNGNIILQEPITIRKDETSYSLFHKLIYLGVSNFEKAFDLVIREKYKGSPQKGEPTYYPREVPFDGFIDSRWEVSKIERYINAMVFPPKPYAKVVINGKEIEVKDIDSYLELVS